MRDIFREGHKLGWQMCCHVTGDAGVDSVLEALSLADAQFPLSERRFTLTHAYFPARDSIALARRLGVCVDTQSYLYYRDSEAIASVYGARWAERFIGLGDWIRGDIPTAINSDHMIGMDPNHAMNSYNPFPAHGNRHHPGSMTLEKCTVEINASVASRPCDATQAPLLTWDSKRTARGPSRLAN